jgi:uncharacterized protein YdeI (YjbR/CyaY-like superfamily)
MGKINATIDVCDYINKLDHPLKKVIVEIREIILSTDNEITEHIKWNAPSFCYRNNDRITFRLNKKDCVQLIFHSGAKGKDSHDKGAIIDDQTGLLEWVADKRALLTFYDIDEVIMKKDSIKQIVQQWLEAV